MKTVSLETAKQLEKVGFPQNTVFSYYKKRKGLAVGSEVYTRERERICASPTADEILDELPKQYITIGFDETIWWMKYKNQFNSLQESMVLADCCAKMYLYLKKEGLL